jgi:hypothetical protein
LRALEPLAAAGKAIQKVAKPAATSGYRSTLGFPKIADDIDTAALVERGLSDKVPVTKKGHEKIAGTKVDGVPMGGLKQRIASDIDDMIAQSEEAGRMIPSYQINRYLEDMKAAHKGTEGGNKAIEEITRQQGSLFDEFGNRLFIKPSELQKYKKKIYQDVYEARTDTARRHDLDTKIKAEKGRGAKDTLEELVPEISDANARYGELAELDEWIVNTVNRMDKIADPSAMKMITNTLKVPGFRSKVAIALNRLAEGDMGWLEKNLNTNEIRTVLALSGAANAEEQAGGM